MKRLIMMVVAMATAAVGWAQDAPIMDDTALAKAIVGTYTTKVTENAGGGRVVTEDTEHFDEEGNYESFGVMTFRATIPQQGNIRLEFEVHQVGKYSIVDGVIKFEIDPDALDMRLKSSGGTELDNMVAEQFEQLFEQQTAELRANPQKINDAASLTVVSIDDKQMVTKPVGGSKKTVHKRK